MVKFYDILSFAVACLQQFNVVPGTRRMVMGHTFKWGINGVCENQAICVVVGMSRGCKNGLSEVLGIGGSSDGL